MARHESQGKRLSALTVVWRAALIQGVRPEIDGKPSSYFLGKEPFVRDGRRYEDERVSYLEGLERDSAELRRRLDASKDDDTFGIVGEFVRRLNRSSLRAGERVAVAKEFLRWLAFDVRWSGM
jgi:hypothetical protein